MFNPSKALIRSCWVYALALVTPPFQCRTGYFMT